MKLYNVVVVYDVFATGADAEDAAANARETILAAIRDQAEPLAPSEQVAAEVRNERDIRDAWKNEKPFVTACVSDADFETLKGKTTLDVYKMLYTKQKGDKK